jgi:succinate dehydrogenase / fumarate reductase, cytochrome b subunit
MERASGREVDHEASKRIGLSADRSFGSSCLSEARALSGRTMADARSRPLSPHLTIWRWGPHMLVSILHRATGIALSFAGLAILTWWLWAIAAGTDSYATFVKAMMSPIGLIVLVGLTWSFFQHLLSGIRHLVMDTGAAFELGINKTFAILTIVGSVLLTVLVWFYFLAMRS